MRRLIVKDLFLVVATIAFTIVVFAPSTWLGDWVAKNSRLRLVYPNGTVWNGTAMLAVSDGKLARLIPGQISWRFQWKVLATGSFALELRHAAVDDAIRVSYDGRGLNIDAGSALLPAGLLSVIGAPFNTISPGGMLRLRWKQLRFASEGFDGELSIDWRAAQSALSPISPLGDFRMTARANRGQGALQLTTLSGPLLLEGSGSMEAGRIRFSGTAAAAPDMRAGLNGLIGVLGPRSGDKVLLNWELQT